MKKSSLLTFAFVALLALTITSCKKDNPADEAMNASQNHEVMRQSSSQMILFPDMTNTFGLNFTMTAGGTIQHSTIGTVFGYSMETQQFSNQGWTGGPASLNYATATPADTASFHVAMNIVGINYVYAVRYRVSAQPGGHGKIYYSDWHYVLTGYSN